MTADQIQRLTAQGHTALGRTARFIAGYRASQMAEKLNLESREINIIDELQFVIGQINQLSESPALTPEAIAPLASQAVTNLKERIDGYRTENPLTITYHSSFSNFGSM